MKLVHKVPGPTGRLPTATKKEKMKKSKTTSISAETKTVEVTATQPVEVMGQPDMVYVQ